MSSHADIRNMFRAMMNAGRPDHGRSQIVVDQKGGVPFVPRANQGTRCSGIVGVREAETLGFGRSSFWPVIPVASRCVNGLAFARTPVLRQICHRALPSQGLGP